jgi:hypothetical protein
MACSRYSASITVKYVFNVIIVLTGTQEPHRESGALPRKIGTRAADKKG